MGHSTRKPFGSVLQHANFIVTVAFLPNGQLVATSGGENTIFLWDISQKITHMTNALSPYSLLQRPTSQATLTR
jgi:WD40 repeat protein